MLLAMLLNYEVSCKKHISWGHTVQYYISCQKNSTNWFKKLQYTMWCSAYLLVGGDGIGVLMIKLTDGVGVAGTGVFITSLEVL